MPVWTKHFIQSEAALPPGRTKTPFFLPSPRLFFMVLAKKINNFGVILQNAQAARSRAHMASHNTPFTGCTDDEKEFERIKN